MNSRCTRTIAAVISRWISSIPVAMTAWCSRACTAPSDCMNAFALASLYADSALAAFISRSVSSVIALSRSREMFCNWSRMVVIGAPRKATEGVPRSGRHARRHARCGHTGGQHGRTGTNRAMRATLGSSMRLGKAVVDASVLQLIGSERLHVAGFGWRQREVRTRILADGPHRGLEGGSEIGIGCRHGRDEAGKVRWWFRVHAAFVNFAE